MSRDPLWESRRKLAQFETVYAKAVERHRKKEEGFLKTIEELKYIVELLEKEETE